MKSLILLLLFLLSYQNENIQFTSDQANQDLEYLRDELATYHSGLYRYTPRDSIEYFFENALVNHSINAYELYSRVTYLLSNVHCGHTRSRMSNQMRNSFENDQKFIPFTIKILNGKYYLNKTLSNDLKPGDQILKINGLDVGEIQDKIFSHLPADGRITTGKKQRTEYYFDVYYQLFVDPEATSYSITILNESGKFNTSIIEGVSWDEMNSLRNSRISDEPLLSLKINEDYAYMRISTFGSTSLQNHGLNYEEFLKESFRNINLSGTTNMVLDLRGNGGGSDNYGALMVSYFARDPFNYFEKIEVTESYPGRSTQTGDTYLMTNHKGLSKWDPQEDRFNGNLFVLIDGVSFSTCADVATVLHFHNWATFIGEETGGGYDGNTSGHTRTITLPNSGIIVNIPMWKYTTANIGHDYPGRGVIPDYQVEPTWEEYIEGVDVVLNKSLELMR